MQWPLMFSEGTDHLVNGSGKFLGRDRLGQAAKVGRDSHAEIGEAKLVDVVFQCPRISPTPLT